MSKDLSHFDYVIIGNGLAGLQLALAFAEDSFFNNKQIALIDKDKKNINDKTWSFWEKGYGKWDDLVTQTWNQALFFSSENKHVLNLKPYRYKTIYSLDFYNEAKARLLQKNNIHFIIDEVLSVEDENEPIIKTKTKKITATHVFDSRITPEFYSDIDNYTRLIQHFRGWIIETKASVFNPEALTMMDYRLKDGEQTTFMYVLPFSKTKALVEFTYFTPEIVNKETYNTFLKKYIVEILKVNDYKITETETGSIPMTNFPFQNFSTKNITKIGTAGGWVKGSTGYSFKHTEKKVAKIVLNLKNSKLPSADLFKNKYSFYDKIFLKVLHDENDKGEWIFEQFYTKNNIETMLRFLDEESSLKEELQIMKSLFSASFVKAFFKTL